MIRIVTLPGDGIGPEVVAQASKVIRCIAERFNHEILIEEHSFGGAALKEVGVPLPEETLIACQHSDAVLHGAIGTPQFDQNPPLLRPETGLLQLRQRLETFANLRPAKVYKSLVAASSLKPEVVEGTDVLIVRELTGGIYFGLPRGIEQDRDGQEVGFNTMRYQRSEIERIAHVAFVSARKRRRKVTSVDKANALETSQLWRRVVSDVARTYPDVRLEHLYVDNCAMQLIVNPRQFDVILTENLFGDILSDEAAMLTGSIGMLPSASLGGRVGLYEPVHGSAPDIAGQNKANPLAAIASAALMFRYAFNLEEEAQAIERAIETVLEQGYRTADIYRGEGPLVGAEEMGDQVCQIIARLSQS
jgi:3-isopropylmalate dehydrogenase